MKFTCPCCGYKTLSERGCYGLCPICFWEDDPAQFEDPDLEGKSNRHSLRQSQLNFIIYNAADSRYINNLRLPTPWDEHDPNWLPLYQTPKSIRFLQRKLQKKIDLPVNLFKAVSFLFFKERIMRYRNIERDERRLDSEANEDAEKARLKALKKVRDDKLRNWLSYAESQREVEFIVGASDSFWKWLEKVKACDHLHLELISESNGIVPLYSCRYCGATVGCECWVKDSWPIQNQNWNRPTALNDFIPLSVFKEIFVKPDICYRCRKDEDLCAPRAYGKNRIARYFWRELLFEEGKARCLFEAEDFQTVDEIIEYSKKMQPTSTLIHLILDNDNDRIIRRIIERALYVKKRMKKMGVGASIREMLKYMIDIGCYVYNKQEGIEYEDYLIPGELINLKKIPLAVYLPWFYGSKLVIEELGLDKNPEKILKMPLIFKIAMLHNFILERPWVDENEVRKLAMSYVKSNVKAFDFDPAFELQRAVEAAEVQDIYLFLKVLQKLWYRDKDFLIKQKGAISKIVTQAGIEWAIMEYRLFCNENYSGFEMVLAQDNDFLSWLTTIADCDFLRILKQGDIITNVVGMRFIEWSRYLDMDRYLSSKDVKLIREHGNQHDKNAISVETEGFGKLGYIKRSVARLLAPIIDGGTMLKAEIFRRYYTRNEIDTSVFLKIGKS